MIAVTDNSRAGVWIKAARKLMEVGPRGYNVVMEVMQPDIGTESTRRVERRVDAFLKRWGAQPLHTVAETIFPATEYAKAGLAGVYAYPTTVYPHIKNLQANRWGTYALRLTQRYGRDGDLFNPLETAIEKMRAQLKSGKPLRGIYELDLNSEIPELKLYDAASDRNRPRGGQCLSHVSLKLGDNRELYLTALYRYQYLGLKALGNLLGLARLQGCIARELDIPVGPLVCHATIAVLEDKSFDEVKWPRREIETLVNESASDLET
jgi:hypothetical protein